MDRLCEFRSPSEIARCSKNLSKRLTDGKLHVTEVSNASRTLLMNIKTLQWDSVLLKFFRIKPSVLPKIVSSSQVYGEVEHGLLKGVKIGGLIGDQQGALVGNKCFHQGEAKCTFGTGAFLLFNTGNTIVKSNSGLLGTVGSSTSLRTSRSEVRVGWLSGRTRCETCLRVGREQCVCTIYSRKRFSSPSYSRGCRKRYQMVRDTFRDSRRNKLLRHPRLRDSMRMIQSSADINTLAASVDTTGDVYFVTAFSGLLAPYWDPAATGILIGISEYTTPAHIARAALEATAFQTYAILECMQSDAGADLKQVKVDGGMTNGDVAMQVLADLGGFTVVRPEMRE